MDILAVNPRGQVPTLIDNGVVVCESGAAVQARAADCRLCPLFDKNETAARLCVCSPPRAKLGGSKAERTLALVNVAGTGCKSLAFVHAGRSTWTRCTRSRRSCPRTARPSAWCARLWSLALPRSPGCLKCAPVCKSIPRRLRACAHVLCFAHRAQACCWHTGAAALSRVERPGGQDQRGVPPQGGWCRHGGHAGVLSSPSLPTAPCLSARA